MRTRRLVLAGLASSAVAGCFGPSATARYRLTLEVAVGDRIVSGSSVHEKTYGRNWLPSAMPFYTRFKGEAVVVDLGERGLLFALLTGRHETGGPISGGFEAMPRDVFARTGAIRVSADQLEQWQTLANGIHKAELQRDEIPFLVRFRDISDLMSIERVDPGALERSFGPGVRLLRTTIETIRDPVTAGIRAKLPWLSRPDVGRFVIKYPIPSSPGLVSSFDAYDFVHPFK